MDLIQHLTRQIAFSRATFGPGERRKGVIDHIRKELKEIEASDYPASEWVDVVILGLDGLWRSLEAGYNRRTPGDDIAHTATEMIRHKQAINELRTWPDWRTADPDKAIEHDRSGE